MHALTTDDRSELLVLVAVARRAQKLREIEHRNLARFIVNDYAQVRRRG
jgi:hypothetical protein